MAAVVTDGFLLIQVPVITFATTVTWFEDRAAAVAAAGPGTWYVIPAGVFTVEETVTVPAAPTNVEAK